MLEQFKSLLRMPKGLIQAIIAKQSGTVLEISSEIYLKKAVIVQVSQGLANQMICYKAARMVASWSDSTLILDASAYGALDNNSNRNFQLHHHRIEYDLLTFDRGLVEQLLRSNSTLHITKDMVYPRNGGEQTEIVARIKAAPIVYFDFWLSLFLRTEADAYAAQSRVMHELSLDYEKCFRCADFTCLEAIKRAADPVAVHVRRGDYTTHDGGLLLSEGYYNRSIRSLERTLASPSFFVVSDDIPWCRDNLRTTSKITFVDWNNDAQGYKDLYLGSRCKHFILSNESTFSHQMVQLSPASSMRIVITSTSIDLIRNAGA